MMKKTTKILVSALLLASMSMTMVPAVIPAVQTTASAALVTQIGKLENGFSWEWDSETKTLTIKDNNSATKIINVQVDEYTSENGYTYYRESKEQGAET